MTSITWASPRYVQELTTILGPQNRTQGSCEYLLYCHLFRLVDMILKTEKNCVAALLVKADSLFNLCLFERALVLYHRWKDTIICYV